MNGPGDGQLARREVHPAQARHRAVHLWSAIAPARCFCTSARCRRIFSPVCGSSSAAGHVGAGEDYDATARASWRRRSLPAAQPPQRLFRSRPARRRARNSCGFYRVEAEGPFVLQAEEIERATGSPWRRFERWLVDSRQELLRLSFIWERARPSLRRALALSRLNSGAHQAAGQAALRPR